MCQIFQTVHWIESLSACIAAIVGAVTGIAGSYILAKHERDYFKRKEFLDTQERRRLAGHRAMLAIESQRCLVKKLFDLNNSELDPRKWAVFVVNRQSIPVISAGELEFLITMAENKNILPKLIMQQQNFDQLVDSVGNFAAIRRELEAALLTGSSLPAMMHQEELNHIAKSILAMFKTILGGYNETQTMLLPGFLSLLRLSCLD